MSRKRTFIDIQEEEINPYFHFKSIVITAPSVPIATKKHQEKIITTQVHQNTVKLMMDAARAQKTLPQVKIVDQEEQAMSIEENLNLKHVYSYTQKAYW